MPHDWLPFVLYSSSVALLTASAMMIVMHWDGWTRSGVIILAGAEAGARLAITQIDDRLVIDR
jgi:hypothetical protein